MPVKILRWSSGAGGDTVLKLFLKSNPTWHSQNRYQALDNGRTAFDTEYVKSFRYDQIAKMSLADFINTDKSLLSDQLSQLEQEDHSKHWILKTHCYFDFDQEVIDIVIGEKFLPFVIKAGLTKNARGVVEVTNYHPLISKIPDPVVLYKFDCYNMALKAVTTKNVSDLQIHLSELLIDWEHFVQSLDAVNLYVDQSCKQYYESWLDSNKKFLPSAAYIELLDNKYYNYNDSRLSIEEKYCLLALSGEKFRLLN